MSILVNIVPLGPVEERFNFVQLGKVLNQAQDIYTFKVEDALTNVPAPTISPSRTGNPPPHYDPNKLFRYLWHHRGGDNRILVGIIDSEIFDDLYSVTDQKNQMILVSLRTRVLSRVLEISRKTMEQYATLEIGAQLLAIQYRKAANLPGNSLGCEKPWHVERRNCLFDYYGLSEFNVQKLRSPKISEQVLFEFRQVELPQRYIDASLSIAKKAANNLWSEVWKELPGDPWINLVLGSILGVLTSLIPVEAGQLWSQFFGIAFLALIFRILFIKKGG